MGFSSSGISTAQVLAEINKYLTNSTNKITDAVVAHIDADVSAAGGGLSTIKITSIPLLNATITTGATDFTLNNVVIPNITGYTIEAAYAVFSIGHIIDTSGANNDLSTTNGIEVDKAAAGWITAIDLPNMTCGILTNARRVGPRWQGSIDISSRVAFNATTNFRLAAAAANGNNLTLHDLQTGVVLVVTKT